MSATNARLLRLAGFSALLAGLCYLVVGVAHPANVPASVTTTRWQVVHVFVCVMSFFGVLGLAGLHARQADKTGKLGLVGYLLLSLWMVVLMGFGFVEAFVLPRLAHAAPAFVAGWMDMFNGGHSTVSMGVLPTLWTITAPLYIGGGVLFGVATYRAGILPRPAAALLALGTAVTPVAKALSLSWQPKIAIPAALGLAWLGLGLMTQRPPAPGHVEVPPLVEAAA